MTIPTRFSVNPVLTMSLIRKCPVPKMIALGGVATGNINASEAASVAGIINSKGLTWMVTARPARMGRIISVVAVLDVSSVSSDIIATITEVRTMGWVPANPDNCSPNQMDRPESTNPLARANPPPNRRTMCQGILPKTSMSRMRGLSSGFALREGIIAQVPLSEQAMRKVRADVFVAIPFKNAAPKAEDG